MLPAGCCSGLLPLIYNNSFRLRKTNCSVSITLEVPVAEKLRLSPVSVLSLLPCQFSIIAPPFFFFIVQEPFSQSNCFMDFSECFAANEIKTKDATKRKQLYFITKRGFKRYFSISAFRLFNPVLKSLPIDFSIFINSFITFIG